MNNSKLGHTMTDKTFPSASSAGGELRVVWQTTGEVGVWVEGGQSNKAYVGSSDAPAIALAILDAAGTVHHDPTDTPYEESERTENMGDLNIAAFHLAQHVHRAEKDAWLAAEAAAEQAELEAEAVELLCAEAAIIHPGKPVAMSLRMWSEDNQKRGLALAKAARKLYRGADA